MDEYKMIAPYPFKKTLTLLKRYIYKNKLIQIGIIIMVWFGCQEIATRSNIPIPGGVIGLLAILILLSLGWMSIRSLALGAEWFLSEMLLFFIPAVPAILNHKEFFGWIGLKILVVIMLGTVIVIVGTALIVDFSFHKLEKYPLGKKQP